VIIGKRGNLWQGYRMLCRALDIPVRYAVAESRLASPPRGPISQAMLYTQAIAMIDGKAQKAWFMLGNKYAPFGYVASDVRGMPAYFLDGAHEGTSVPAQAGDTDGIAFSGRGKLDATGALTIDLVATFSGKLAMSLRRGLAQVSEQNLHQVLESNLLAQTLRGGSLVGYSIDRRDDYDAPLVVRMAVKVARFAEPRGAELVLTPPFGPDLRRLATLPERETPLLIPETVHREVAVDVELPPGAAVSPLGGATLSDGSARVVIADTAKNGVLHLGRTIDIPAGRIQPDAYPRFAELARRADDALSRAIRITPR
jgi:hypothetical protein